jgi:hypothetical protein
MPEVWPARVSNLLTQEGRSTVCDQVQGISDGAADAELAHAGLQGGALHPEQDGGAAWSGNAPSRVSQSAEDVLTLGFFERGDVCAGGRAKTDRRGFRRSNAHRCRR